MLKPGAEKIIKLLGLADTYEIMGKIADWENGLFQYEIKCSLVSIMSGVVVAQGVGECNSYEVRYRYRQAKRICPMCEQETIIKGKAEYGGGWVCFTKLDGCGEKYSDGDKAVEDQQIGRVHNPDPADQINTYLKIAKKRAMVDAALSVGSLSELFTQDMEDYKQREEAPPTPQRKSQPQQRRSQGRKPSPPAEQNEDTASANTKWDPADLLALLKAEPSQWPVIFATLDVKDATALTKLYPNAARASEVFGQRMEEGEVMDETGVRE